MRIDFNACLSKAAVRLDSNISIAICEEVLRIRFGDISLVGHPPGRIALIRQSSSQVIPVGGCHVAQVETIIMRGFSLSFGLCLLLSALLARTLASVDTLKVQVTHVP